MAARCDCCELPVEMCTREFDAVAHPVWARGEDDGPEPGDSRFARETATRTVTQRAARYPGHCIVCAYRIRVDDLIVKGDGGWIGECCQPGGSRHSATDSAQAIA